MTQPKPRYTRGVLAKYTALVSTASKGAGLKKRRDAKGMAQDATPEMRLPRAASQTSRNLIHAANH